MPIGGSGPLGAAPLGGDILALLAQAGLLVIRLLASTQVGGAAPTRSISRLIPLDPGAEVIPIEFDFSGLINSTAGEYITFASVNVSGLEAFAPSEIIDGTDGSAQTAVEQILKIPNVGSSSIQYPAFCSIATTFTQQINAQGTLTILAA